MKRRPDANGPWRNIEGRRLRDQSRADPSVSAMLLVGYLLGNGEGLDLGRPGVPPLGQVGSNYMVEFPLRAPRGLHMLGRQGAQVTRFWQETSAWLFAGAIWELAGAHYVELATGPKELRFNSVTEHWGRQWIRAILPSRSPSVLVTRLRDGEVPGLAGDLLMALGDTPGTVHTLAGRWQAGSRAMLHRHVVDRCFVELRHRLALSEESSLDVDAIRGFRDHAEAAASDWNEYIRAPSDMPRRLLLNSARSLY